MPSFSQRRFVVIEPQALSAAISLEALGLLVHITDACESEALQQRFPEYDIDALANELLIAGLVSAEPSATTPKIEPRTLVYVAAAGLAFKIGVTGNLKRRLKQLRTHSPFPPVIIWQRPFEDAVAIEQKLHSALVRHRTHGEWFVCDRAAIDAAIASVCGDSSPS